MSSEEKPPISFDVFFTPIDQKHPCAGLLNGFVQPKKEYDWFAFDLNMDEKNPNPIIFINPKKMTKEKFLKINKGIKLHPSRLHYVTNENFEQFKKDLLTGTFYKSGTALKVTGKVTISPPGPIEVEE